MTSSDLPSGGAAPTPGADAAPPSGPSRPAATPESAALAAPTGADAPLVSVVIPSYRRAHTVAAAVRSVLAQTLTDLDVVVVDDASGDDTEQVIRAIDDPRVRYVAHRTNLGGNAARRTGIAESRGRYIAFLDSDDTWLPTKLEKQVALLQAKGPTYGLCATWYTVQDGHGNTLRTQTFDVDGVAVPDLLVANHLGGYSSVLVSRAALEAVGGPDPDLRACQDWDLYLRVNRTVGVCTVHEPLVVYIQDVDDPVRISTRRASVRSGLDHIFEAVSERRSELDDEHLVESLKTFLSGQAAIGAPLHTARVAAAVPPRLWNRDLVTYAVHMQARAVRKLLASRTVKQ